MSKKTSKINSAGTYTFLTLIDINIHQEKFEKESMNDDEIFKPFKNCI